MNDAPIKTLWDNDRAMREIESLRQQLTAALDEARMAKVSADEVRSTYAEEMRKLSQQLAAALAACKGKDEVIKQASNYIDVLGGYSKQHRQALAIQPDDSADLPSP